MTALREQILAIDDLQEEEITIPEWKGIKLLIRSMSGLVRAQFIKTSVGPDGKVDPVKGYAELAITCTYDPSTGKKDAAGKWVEEPEKVFKSTDREPLMEKNGNALETIALAALRMNGLGDIGQKAAAGPLETPTPNGGHTSSLPTS